MLAGLALLALGAAFLWWWAGTDDSLAWALRQLSARQPVVVEEARGSLRTGVRAARVTWARDGLKVEVRELELAWQPLSLLRGLLKLDRLRAASVRVEDRRQASDEKPAVPQSLALPARVAIDEFAIGQVQWDGAADLEARDLAARYVFDGQEHRLDLRSLRLLDGQYRGEVRLGAHDRLPLRALLQGRIEAPVPGAGPVPLVFEAALDGPLADLQARVQLQGQQGTATAATRATATARLTPWAEVPLAQGRAELRALDLGALWRQAPRTSLSGVLAVQPAGTATWSLAADLTNSLAGPWDRDRLPAQRLQLEGEWRQGRALVRSLTAEVGAGRIAAQGQWQGDQAWALAATLQGINPAALHTAMAPVPLGGKASARAQGAAVAFEADLAASGRAAAGASSELAAAVGALELRSVHARGRWAGQRLDLPELSVRTRDAALDAELEITWGQALLGRGRADLKAPGLGVRAAGSLGQTNGGGVLRAAAADLALAQAWLLTLPEMPEVLAAASLAGRAELQAAWQGGWRDPSLQGSLSIPVLTVRPMAGAEPAWSLADTTVRFGGPLADLRLDVRAKGRAGERQGSLELMARGGQRPAGAWQALVESLDLRVTDPAAGPGAWRLSLRSRVELLWSRATLTASAGEAVLAPPAAAGVAAAPAVLAWDPARWDGGELRTSGRLIGLPLGWLALFGGPQLAGGPLSGDLVFDGQWDASLGPALRLRASLVRTRGDLTVLAEAADGATARVPAGVREARLTLEGSGESVELALQWESERAGTAQARIGTRLARGGAAGWEWPASAPLTGRVQARLPRLGVWSVLAPPGWRLRGSVTADVGVSGTRGDPALGGTVQAEDLALRSVVDGIELQDGRLRARLDGRRVLVDEFMLRGAGTEGGTLTATGEAGWTGAAPQARGTARLQNLRVSARADRLLTVSGDIAARVAPSGAVVQGNLRVDQALIVLPEETAPELGEDVVVRNAPAGFPVRGSGASPGSAGRRDFPLELAVQLNLGDSFRVRGRGIETRLSGTLAVSADSLAQPRLNGAIQTVGGEYRAYNQRLEIQRGVLRFTGPIDNPALDVIAIRPRMEQRVGVQVTGRAQAPFVRLYAEPDLPEAEKLSWLVLGRASATGGAEAALLQQAALALVASRTGGGTGRGPAALLGLDELGFRRDGTDGPAVTLGKRLGQNLYASYERSLSGALGTLYLFYDLSRRLTVRAQAGERTAVDLILTFRYD
jgi:translocation and assembly module TamB